MAENGYVTARIYTSKGNLPIEGAVVTVTLNDTNPPQLLGKRTTDKNGLTTPITVQTPDKSLSQNPTDERPFAVVDVRVDHPDYYTIYVDDAQVFAAQTSVIDTGLIPLAENEVYNNMAERFLVTAQNL